MTRHLAVLCAVPLALAACRHREAPPQPGVAGAPAATGHETGPGGQVPPGEAPAASGQAVPGEGASARDAAKGGEVEPRAEGAGGDAAAGESAASGAAPPKGEAASSALGAPKVPPVEGGGALVPPKKVGASRFRLSGCLTAATEADARRYEKAPTRAGAGEPTVTVKPVAGGALVVHELTHACCLKAKVSSRADGARFVVTEKLTGSACRCQCNSVIRTAIALPAGKHAVAVDLDHGGGVKRVFEGEVETPSASTAPRE